MTKVKTLCECGGSYDGTPSGKAKHEATQRHGSYVQDERVARITAEKDAAVESTWIADGGADPTADPLNISNVIPLYNLAASPEQNALYETIRYASVLIEKTIKELKKLEADRKWRETRAPHLVGKYDSLIATAESALREAEAEKAAARAQVDAINAAQQEKRREFWAQLDAVVFTEFETDSDVYVHGRSKGNYEVALTTGKILQNAEGVDYPEIRFGFEVTVNGPEETYSSDDRTVTFAPAYARWGSFSGNRSPEANDDALRIITVGIELSRFINRKLGL